MTTAAEARASLANRNVSRETLEKLQRFVALLEKWNPKINLVSKATLPVVWERHILDSAQLHPLIAPDVTTVVDIGTGGGFPGAVLAILMQHSHPDAVVAMVESDKRKCAFLQTVLTELQIPAEIHMKRVENLSPLAADLMTSRALAPLEKLLGFASRHLGEGGKALFLKGANAEAEVNEALASWQFDLQKKASETSADAVVLEIFNIRPQ